MKTSRKKVIRNKGTEDCYTAPCNLYTQCIDFQCYNKSLKKKTTTMFIHDMSPEKVRSTHTLFKQNIESTCNYIISLLYVHRAKNPQHLDVPVSRYNL